MYEADRMDDAPSGPPTSAEQQPYEVDLRYRPLHWLSLTATCRNCPRTNGGNYNLLASNADSAKWRNESSSGNQHQHHQRAEAMAANDLVLEDVCFCPVIPARSVSNGTILATHNVDMFFPKAEAPTSMDLMDLINHRIKELRASRILVNIESFAELTEPDYDYYALEIEGTFAEPPAVETADEDPNDEVIERDGELDSSNEGAEEEGTTTTNNESVVDDN